MTGPLVAVDQTHPAELRQPAVRAAVLRAGIVVAELAGEIEAQALGELLRLGDGLRMVVKTRRRLLT